MKLRYDEDPTDMYCKLIVSVTRLKRTPKGFKQESRFESEWREPDPGKASEKEAEIWNWMVENCPHRTKDGEAPNSDSTTSGSITNREGTP